jgi:hypothetical protein
VQRDVSTLGEAMLAASDCLNVELAPFPSPHLLLAAWRRGQKPPAKLHPVFCIYVMRAGQEFRPGHELQFALLDGDSVLFSRVIGST